LTDLKEVEIRRCRGKDHEVDLLKVLLRCATMLERVTLRFSRKFPPSDHGCKEVDGILKAYPSVKCNIYQVSIYIYIYIYIFQPISGGNQPLHVNYENFNLSHTMLIQQGAKRRWEE
jgi:hypothetical protein